MGELYRTTRFFNVSVYFLHDILLRVKCLVLTVFHGSGFLRNLFYLLTSVSVEVLLSRSGSDSKRRRRQLKWRRMRCR